jgi:uncharacterized protein (DUF697 family)
MSDDAKPNDAKPAEHGAPAPADGAAPAEGKPIEPPKSAEETKPEEAKPAAPRKQLCRDKARSLVHKYALFGTAWAVLPIPGVTSTGLTALEAHMIYWIARIYGETPNATDITITTAGLEMASVGLKKLAVELAGLVPAVGWGVKGAIAGSTIEGLGELIIRHFESKYPNKEVA